MPLDMFQDATRTEVEVWTGSEMGFDKRRSRCRGVSVSGNRGPALFLISTPYLFEVHDAMQRVIIVGVG